MDKLYESSQLISVKYIKEKEIFSHHLTCCPRLNKKKCKNRKKENTKFHFYRKIIPKLSLLLIILQETKSKLTLMA